MDTTVNNDEVIDLENSEEDDDDVNLTMEVIPFKEKVENWLLNCNGAHAKALARGSKRVLREQTVVVKEVIDETESLHSVDTEQYIKSNRRKTTTKITTTTIKKYYSMVQVAKNAYNNNDEGYSGDGEPLLTIDLASNDKDRYSCKVNRKRVAKPSYNLRSVPEQPESHQNPKKPMHQTQRECDTNRLNVDDGISDLDRGDSTVQDISHDRIKIARKCRTPHNTRLNKEAKNKIRLCTEVFNKKPRRSTAASKKQKQQSGREKAVKLRPDIQPPEKGAANSQLNTVSLRNPWDIHHFSSDSEQDDILLTSYKPFSLCP